MKYFIYWKSLLTGYIGYGQCIYENESDVLSEVQKLDIFYSNRIVHYYLESRCYNEFTTNISNWPIGL